MRRYDITASDYDYIIHDGYYFLFCLFIHLFLHFASLSFGWLPARLVPSYRYISVCDDEFMIPPCLEQHEARTSNTQNEEKELKRKNVAGQHIAPDPPCSINPIAHAKRISTAFSISLFVCFFSCPMAPPHRKTFSNTEITATTPHTALIHIFIYFPLMLLFHAPL